jgi:hypothetical protein
MRKPNPRTCLLITYCDGEINFYRTNTDVADAILQDRQNKNDTWQNLLAELHEIPHQGSLSLPDGMYEKIIYVDMDFYTF